MQAPSKHSQLAPFGTCQPKTRINGAILWPLVLEMQVYRSEKQPR